MDETPKPEDPKKRESKEPAEVDQERREGWEEEAGRRASTDAEEVSKKEEEEARSE